MNRSDQERFEQLLHAYELGTLSAAEEEEFELLVLEYPALFDEVQRLETAAHLMRNDPEIREHLTALIQTLPETEKASAGKIPLQPTWKRLWFAYAAAAAIIVVLTLVDWRLEFHPSSEVIAAENRIAVMFFSDQTDPQGEQQWGEIATHLIVTDLSESRYMQVVSQERIVDLLAAAGQTRRQIDRKKALDLAQASDARWLLMGEILLTQPSFAISAQLIDVPSGDLAATLEVYGRPEQDIFAVVDELSTKIKAGLSLPSEARVEIDVPVADMTTHSPEAYRCFLAGKSLYDKYYLADAWTSLQKAVKLDSTFAIAYYYLYRLSDPDALAKAVRFVGQASQRDQVYIRMGEAISQNDHHRAIAELEQAIRRFPDYKEFYYYLGVYYRALREYEHAISHLKAAIAMDPLYKNAYNELAYTYAHAGQGDLALRTADELVAVAPDEANSWDSKGELYAEQGRIDEARAAFTQALAVKPDFHHSAFALGLLYLREGDGESAAGYITSQANNPNIFARYEARSLLALIPQTRGEYRQALKTLEKGINADSAETCASGFRKYPQQMRQKLLARARIYTELGDRQSAMHAGHQVLDFSGPDIFGLLNQGFYLSTIQLLAVNGDTLAARRQIDIWQSQASSPMRFKELRQHIAGAIAFFAGDWQAAIVNLNAGLQEWFDVYSAYLLAHAYLQTGETDQAIAWLEKTLLCRTQEMQIKFCFYQPQVYFLLGRAYHEAGDAAKTQVNFQRFLQLWENADAGLEKVDQAKAYLAHMTMNN